MRSAADLKNEIEKRLKNYLSRDKNGIRRTLLNIFVKAKSLTIAETHKRLADKFEVSYQSVASMVGIIASRIGIFHVIKSKDNDQTCYKLKDQYADLVERAVSCT
ncbi:DUF2551 domain-containing protein [Methanoplanus sp. FWC-SCC4]|uniref:DUF2551 domain-containing protein n=1 Tax=Methanochimaera problematica TaxID=2609417 RepID=A0AA97I3M8_9EURY|nr:DUF2551 domain-containing protein [Methanoplanus sp. FWC-SCC4]WOF16061.1 DUF2551 domain-containing protein [Methanoplanus sp. FWC-SCC4]